MHSRTSLVRAGAILALAGTLQLEACSSSAPLAETRPLPDGPSPVAYRRTLVPDDLLLVSVFGHPDLSTSPDTGVRIDQQGKLHLPLAGTVRVAGLSLEEARDAIQAAFARYVREPSVGLSVLEFAVRPVYVLGDVDTSGAYDLERPMTALQAVSLGGGFRPYADRKHVALLREEGDEYVVRFFDAATPGPEGLIPVQPGDVLFVRQTGGGGFREQILPYIQGIFLPAAAAATLVRAYDDITTP